MEEAMSAAAESGGFRRRASVASAKNESGSGLDEGGSRGWLKTSCVGFSHGLALTPLRFMQSDNVLTEH